MGPSPYFHGIRSTQRCDPDLAVIFNALYDKTEFVFVGIQDEGAITGSTRDLDDDIAGGILPDLAWEGIEMRAQDGIDLPLVADGRMRRCQFCDEVEHGMSTKKTGARGLSPASLSGARV